MPSVIDAKTGEPDRREISRVMGGGGGAQERNYGVRGRLWGKRAMYKGRECFSD